MKKLLQIKTQLRASTIVEIMIVMIISGIVIGFIFDGINIFRRYSQKLTDEITTSSDLLNSYLSLETIIGRSDSLTNDKGIVKLYRKGAIMGELELIESKLIINFLNQIDTFPSNVESVEANLGTQTDTLKIETETITLMFQTVKQAKITTIENEKYEY